MAGELSSLTELTSGNLDDNDLLEVVDVSDTSMAGSGTNKKSLFSSIKSTLKTYFDGLYATAAQGTDSRAPTAHAGTHTNGTDDIQSATNAQKGLATAAHITAIEANTAKVTNATHTGDATGATALTLATVNSNVGSFGSATAAPAFTVNAKGLVTAASTNTITPAIGSITGLGTGIATALGVNIGSAGAPVLFNGDAGTPSSIVLTNATGTAASLTAGTATAANGLKTATTTVAVASATAPSPGQVLTATSSTAATWQTPSGGGKVAQVISATNSTPGSTSTIIPYDGSIPQITEGASAGIDCAITPTNASSTLIIDVELNLGSAAAGNEAAGAIFVDSTTDALRAADVTLGSSGFVTCVRFRHIIAAGSTSTRTYRARYGPYTGTLYLNRSNGQASLYGGVLTSSMTVTEILP